MAVSAAAQATTATAMAQKEKVTEKRIDGQANIQTCKQASSKQHAASNSKGHTATSNGNKQQQQATDNSHKH